MKPKLLDLFAGAGGAGRGYMDAGFDVTGIDTCDERAGVVRLRFDVARLLRNRLFTYNDSDRKQK